jgi:integrase
MRTTSVSLQCLPKSHWSGYLFRVRWSVSSAAGKAIRKSAFFHHRREAERFATEKRRALKEHGAEHAEVTANEQAALVRFREWKKSNPETPDLAAVVENAIATFAAAQGTMTVSEAISVRLDAAHKRGLSVRHLEDLRARLTRFAVDFGARPIAGVTREEIDAWLHRLGVAPQTWRNYGRVIGSVFTLFVKRGTIARNPAANLDAPKKRNAAPSVLSPLQVRRLLSVADPEILPSLVLQAFCGVRRAESMRLSWGHVRLDAKSPFIELPSSVTKTNRRRNPPIPENAAAWLRNTDSPQHGEIGIAPARYRELLTAAAAAAGITWEENLLRHSFATYRLAVTMNAAQVSEEMGNSPNVVRANYQNVTSPETAHEWFAVFPGQHSAEIVPFHRTA